MQTNIIGSSKPHLSVLDEINDVAWDFEGQRSRSSLSSTHFHPGRFISQLPSVLISILSKEHETVLDPFCGSGTTLVEAQRLSRKSIGIDINPVSIMIAKAKTLGWKADQVEQILTEFMMTLTRTNNNFERTALPENVQMEKWYGNNVGADLCKLYWEIESSRIAEEKLLKQYCFSSILLKVCRETRHWGYVCDNTKPQGTPHRDVWSSMQNAVRQTVAGYKEQQEFVGHNMLYPPNLLHDQAENVASLVQESSVDLVVTSPPYFGVVDYVKAQRLTIEWFGHDLGKFRNLETGARSKRHRQKSLEQFEQELSQTFEGLSKVLRPSGHCAVVFGASKSRRFQVESLKPLVEQYGLETIGAIERSISSQRRMNPSLNSETLFLFRKPS